MQSTESPGLEFYPLACSSTISCNFDPEIKPLIMKRTLVLSVLMLLASVALSQGVSPYSVRNIQFGLGINSDIWLNTPDELELKSINRGVNIFLMYRHRFGESNFGISGGLALASQNMYIKNAILRTNENGVSFFDALHDTITFQRNKLNLNFIEVPLEFNYKTRNHINFALGAKAGYLISDKTKYKGSNYQGNNTGDIKMKMANNDNLLNYRLGAYAVIGYKWFNLTAYYGFTKLFEQDFGPEMSPVTVGILVRPN